MARRSGPTARGPGSTATRSARRTQRRGDLTRDTIIDETVRCVLEEGFGAASARHVAERAGVTWGVIQYYFGDRDALLMAVVDAGWDHLQASLRAVDVPTGTIRVRVDAVVGAAWAAFSCPVSMAALEILIATRGERTEQANRHLVRIARSLNALGCSLAPRAEAASSAVIGEVLWAALRGLVLARMVVRDERQPTRELSAIIDLLVSYLDRAAAGGEATGANTAEMRGDRR